MVSKIVPVKGRNTLFIKGGSRTGKLTLFNSRLHHFIKHLAITFVFFRFYGGKNNGVARLFWCGSNHK
ncbi:MAG: hypothetical protein CSA39_05740 [Flavobacteriales bacterium]|nr:MAG: hypothetical protein CSA39_05740 [Flavobacteriales bacterium]